MTLEYLDDKDFSKAIQLKQIYGVKGLADLCIVSITAMEKAFVRIENKQLLGWDKQTHKTLRYGIRKYWKPWMANCLQVIK